MTGAGAAAWWVLHDEGSGSAEVEPVVGFVFGSVEDADGNGVGAAEVEVTEAGSDRAVGTATTDELGLFEVDLGRHEGPVVVRATSGDQGAATVVAVRADGMVTGLRLVVGPAGPGSVSGQVVAAEGVTFDPGPAGTDPGTEGGGGAGLVEARFVETGRTDVVAIGPDGRYRLDGLPLDGDLIVVATTAAGTNQGLTATVVSESLTTNNADITLRAPSVATAAEPGEQPAIVTEDLSDWVVDGSVTVVPADELG